MNKRKEARKQLAQLKRDEDKLVKDLARAVANYEKLNGLKDSAKIELPDPTVRAQIEDLNKKIKIQVGLSVSVKLVISSSLNAVSPWV